MALGLLWLPIEAYEGLTNSDIALAYWKYLLGSLILGVTVFVVDGHFVGGILKNQIVISSNSFDTKIRIVFGDIFTQEGWISIAVNDFFDHIVDDELVSMKSLHGEVIMRYWNEDGTRWRDQVYDDIRDTIYDEVTRHMGNTRRYKIGTTARASSGNKDFLFMALGRTDIGDNVTHATADSLVYAVRQLLVRARSVCANRPLNMPLFGSGLSRIGIKGSVLVHLILAAVFEETKISKVTETIVLVLPVEKKREIDLGEILRSWS